jgi:HPt (histidine-containing phosphotransfer) domain-containing protein
MKVIDVERLSDVFDDDAAEIADVIELLISTADSLAKCMTSAFEKQDALEGARLAHELKGAAGNAGAEALCESSQRVEIAFRGRNWQEVASSLSAMRDCLDVLHRETAAILGRA